MNLATGRLINVSYEVAEEMWDEIKDDFDFHEDMLPPFIERHLPDVANESELKYRR